MGPGASSSALGPSPPSQLNLVSPFLATSAAPLLPFPVDSRLSSPGARRLLAVTNLRRRAGELR